MRNLFIILLCLVFVDASCQEFSKIYINGSKFIVDHHSIIMRGVNYFPISTEWPPKLWKRFDSKIIDRDFRKLESLGINSVRIFTSFSFFKDSVTIDKFYIKKLDTLLNIAYKYKLYVLLVGPTTWEGVPKWASRDKFTNEVCVNAFQIFWKYIASRYKNNNTIFAYDLYNEPRIVFNYTGYDKFSVEQVLAIQKQKEYFSTKWVHELVDIIKDQDKKALVTVGLDQTAFPINQKHISIYSGFRPHYISKYIDFFQFHFYPKFDGVYQYENLKVLRNNLIALNWIITNLIPFKKPIVIGEFGWYSGSNTKIDKNDLIASNEKKQLNYCKQVITTFSTFISGWYNWSTYDYPNATDITKSSGLFDSVGNIKSVGKKYSNMIEERNSNNKLDDYKVDSLLWNKLISDFSFSKDYFSRLFYH